MMYDLCRYLPEVITPMVKQLLLCKRLMSEAVSYAERNDAVASGMAISLLQDSVEMFIWALIKEKGQPVRDGASFTSNIETLQKAGIHLSHTAKLLELNKARVGFKHYGNLPAPDEAGKFQAYVEDFLRTSFSDHFSKSFDDISLVDLVSFSDVRERLKCAEALVAKSDFEKAASEAAIAKEMLFSRLDRFVPKVDHNLRDMDSIMHHIPELRGARTFQYLTEYLGALRETTLVALLKLPLQDYVFIRNALPNALQFGNGEWKASNISRRRSYDATICNRAIACLVNMAIRLESVI